MTSQSSIPLSYADPLPGPVLEPAPPRRAESIRRTSHLDVTTRAGDGFMNSIVSIGGGARDLVTDAEGVAAVVAVARLHVSMDGEGRIDAVEQDPVWPACDELLGTRVGFGFRSAVKNLLVDLTGSPLGLLVDDLSGAPAPSGYGAIRERTVLGLPDPPIPAGAAGVYQQADVCAGWRTGGLPLRSRMAGQSLPFSAEPPVAPSLQGADAVAWHAMDRLKMRQSRRIRRLDLWADGAVLRVDAMFRDVTVDPDPDLTVRVVHEYALTAEIDPDSLTVLAAHADPRSLPFATDCPFAASSAELIVGHHVGDLRTAVRTISRGAHSCTHLNDLLRSLADVSVLAPLLPRQG
jgi:Protein of unknown function (DUF2889)